MSAAERFFADVAAHADTAEVSADVTESWYRIADLILLIRFVGSALRPVIAPAIAHREIAPPTSAPDLILRCWDCTTLDQPFPASPIDRDSFRPRGEVPVLCDTRYHMAFEPGGRLLSMFDRHSGQAFYCVGDASDIPRFDAAEPIRILLSWFMRAHDRQLVHAAAVGSAQGGVLLMGRSGAGKSNTSLTCLQAGMGFVSDDFCAVSACEPPWAYSLYATAKTREADAERSPFLRLLGPEPDPTGRDKTIHYLLAAAPDRLLEGFPIKAVLLVQQSVGPCRLTPSGPAAALASSAPDTARLLADAGGEVLRTLGQLVRRVPCYTLHLGSDPMAIAPAINLLLEELGGRARTG